MKLKPPLSWLGPVRALAGAIACGLVPFGPAAAQSAPPPTSPGEAVYLVLVGEMQVAAQQVGVGYSILMEAARKSGDAGVYRRAAAVALQSRSFDAALETAKAWATALPNDTDPHRLMLQILLGTQRIDQSREPLNRLLKLVPSAERGALIDVAGASYAAAKDLDSATRVLTDALQPWLQDTTTAPHAWAAMGALAAKKGNVSEALDSLKRALSTPLSAAAPGLLAVQLMSQGVPQAEILLTDALAKAPAAPTEVRLAYARQLVASGRTDPAQQQLELLTAQDKNVADAWLLLGLMALQQNRWDAAEKHFLQYLETTEGSDTQRVQRGKSQSLLALAQIAEKKKDFRAALDWLDRIETDEDPLPVNTRRASILAQQGRLAEARTLLRTTPTEDTKGERDRWMAEVQLLRGLDRLDLAYETLKEASQRHPHDEDMAYEKAMVAEKLGRADEMEQILRALIAQKPDYHHAYNALGYSLADRGLRLEEAKALILKALDLAPGDPFIIDSLGWVEYRLGNTERAAELLQQAYDKRADTEIAVHLGEVLWALGKKDDARAVLTRAKNTDADNELLKNTLARLGLSL